MIDNTKLQKLLSMSDEDFRKKVSDAAIAAGADKYMTAKALSDTAKLRSMLASLTPEQVNMLLSQMSPDAASEIAKRIDNA